MPEFEQLKSKTFTKLAKYCANFGNHFLIAVSGGGDSLALAKLCHDFSESNENIKFETCVIDHGIAQNSHEIAQNAAQQLNEIGLGAKILKPNFKIDKPLQENARKARFDLLTQYANEIGAFGILLGHNFDDQIETIIFRLLRKTNLMGLIGIEEIKYNNEFAKPAIFLRPLMHSKRNELRAFLRKENIDYFDDPANENQIFSRVMIRKRLANLAIDSEKLISIAQNALGLRNAFDEIALKFIEKCGNFDDGKIIIQTANFCQQSQSVQIHILGRIIETLANSNHPIGIDKLQRLFQNYQTPDFKSQVIANVLIKKSKGRIIFEAAPLRKHQKNIIEAINSLHLKSQLWARFNQFGDIQSNLG